MTRSANHRQKVEGGKRTEELLAPLETQSSHNVSVTIKRPPPLHTHRGQHLHVCECAGRSNYRTQIYITVRNCVTVLLFSIM